MEPAKLKRSVLSSREAWIIERKKHQKIFKHEIFDNPVRFLFHRK